MFGVPTMIKDKFLYLISKVVDEKVYEWLKKLVENIFAGISVESSCREIKKYLVENNHKSIWTVGSHFCPKV